ALTAGDAGRPGAAALRSPRGPGPRGRGRRPPRPAPGRPRHRPRSGSRLAPRRARRPGGRCLGGRRGRAGAVADRRRHRRRLRGDVRGGPARRAGRLRGATVNALAATGVRLHRGSRLLVWESDAELGVASTAVLGGGLAAGAALNVLATVTEAKVLALLAAGVRTADGEPASGTATDAVVVAWPAAGRPRAFGGPATAPGWAAAAATRQALREALEGIDGLAGGGAR